MMSKKIVDLIDRLTVSQLAKKIQRCAEGGLEYQKLPEENERIYPYDQPYCSLTRQSKPIPCIYMGRGDLKVGAEIYRKCQYPLIKNRNQE